MRCVCCNRNLTNYESCLKHPDTLEYLDTCKRCLEDIPVAPLAPLCEVDDTPFDDDFDGLDFEGDNDDLSSEY
jgi:hypothetical protein